MTTGQTTGVEIRRRRDSDLEGLAEILERVQETDLYPLNRPPDMVAWLSGPRTLDSWVATAGPDERVVGQVSRATAGGDQAASVWCGALECSESELAVVKRLFVDPAWRGSGIGRLLLGAVVSDAHRLGLRPVLDVDVGSERANALYIACGFALVGTMELTWTGLGGTFRANCYAGPPPR